MPQGKVIAVKPGLKMKSGDGEIEAISDQQVGIHEGEIYAFKNGPETEDLGASDTSSPESLDSYQV